MYSIHYTRLFKKSLKRITNSGSKKIVKEVVAIVEKLSEGKKLEEKFRDHGLTGELKEYRECHVRPDVLLIYYYSDGKLFLVNIGSHSQLF